MLLVLPLILQLRLLSVVYMLMVVVILRFSSLVIQEHHAQVIPNDELEWCVIEVWNCGIDHTAESKGVIASADASRVSPLCDIAVQLTQHLPDGTREALSADISAR